jgi:hypothetical protein
MLDCDIDSEVMSAPAAALPVLARQWGGGIIWGFYDPNGLIIGRDLVTLPY